jgi:hypothetical protein
MRPTETITIGDHTYEVKTYASAREVAAMQAELEKQGGDGKNSAIYAAQLEIVRQLVVKMDDSTEAIPDRVQDLPVDDFLALAQMLDARITKKKVT